jgi:hypothetical protein
MVEAIQMATTAENHGSIPDKTSLPGAKVASPRHEKRKH